MNSASFFRPVATIAILLIVQATMRFSPVAQARLPNGLSAKKPLRAGVSGAAEGFNPLIFLPPVPYDSGAQGGLAVAIADLNGDGYADLIVGNDCLSSCGGGPGRGAVDVLLGNGDGTFKAAVDNDSGGYAVVSVAVGDLNGDGKPDLVVANYCQVALGCGGSNANLGGVGVLLGNGDGTFRAAISYGSGGYIASSIALADLNSDGHADVIIGNYCISASNCFLPGSAGEVSVMLGNGDGTLGAPVSYNSGGYNALSIVIADLNSDGRPDVIVANACQSSDNCSSGSATVLLGAGNGTLQNAISYPSGGRYGESVAVGDLNGDAHPDLVMHNACPLNGDCSGGGLGVVSVLLGLGNATFQPAVGYFSGGRNGGRAVLGDVNNDGKLDIIVASSLGVSCNAGGCGSGAVSLLLGNGDGTVQQSVGYPSGGINPEAVALGDLNGDSKPDIAAVNLCCQNVDGSVAVLLNNNGAPASSTSLVASVNPVNAKQVVTYTATVLPQAGGDLTGIVNFVEGVNTIAAVPLANNQATYSTSYTKHEVGAHTITAAYGGELKVATGSQSDLLTEYVRNASTSTTISTSGSPALVGQPVTFTATVTSRSGNIPNGETVEFSAGKTVLGTGTTLNGVSTVTVSFSKARTYTIKATYSGDNFFKPSGRTLTQIVIP